jgi:KUP system potassium uptake protein
VPVDAGHPARLHPAPQDRAHLLDPAETTYFLGRETVIASQHPGMMLWPEKLFAFMSRNASSATAYFCLPPDRVVEMGSQVEI